MGISPEMLPGKRAVINNIVITLSQDLPTHAYRGFKGVNESERVRSLILEILKVYWVVMPNL
jgi:hypothetical protein